MSDDEDDEVCQHVASVRQVEELSDDGDDEDTDLSDDDSSGDEDTNEVQVSYHDEYYALRTRRAHLKNQAYAAAASAATEENDDDSDESVILEDSESSSSAQLVQAMEEDKEQDSESSKEDVQLLERGKPGLLRQLQEAKGSGKGKGKAKAAKARAGKGKGKGKAKSKATARLVESEAGSRLPEGSFCREPLRLSDPLEPCKHLFVFRREQPPAGSQRSIDKRQIDSELEHRRTEAKKKAAEERGKEEEVMPAHRKHRKLSQKERLEDYKRIAEQTISNMKAHEAHEEALRNKMRDAASLDQMRRKEWKPGDPPRMRRVSRVVKESSKMAMYPGQEIRVHSRAPDTELNGKSGRIIAALPNDLWRCVLYTSKMAVDVSGSNLELLQASGVENFIEYFGVSSKVCQRQSHGEYSSKESVHHADKIILECGQDYGSFDKDALIEEIEGPGAEPIYPPSKVCVVTGGFGKYAHPETGLRYASKDAYARLKHVYSVSGMSGCLKEFCSEMDNDFELRDHDDSRCGLLQIFRVLPQPALLDPATRGVAIRVGSKVKRPYRDYILKWDSQFLGYGGKNTRWIKLKGYKMFVPSTLLDGTPLIRSIGVPSEEHQKIILT